MLDVWVVENVFVILDIDRPWAALPLGERDEEEAAGAEEDVAPPVRRGGRIQRRRDVLANRAVGAIPAQLQKSIWKSICRTEGFVIWDFS